MRTELETKSNEGLMTLMNLRGIGPKIAKSLAQIFSSFEELLAARNLEKIIGAPAAGSIRNPNSLAGAWNQAIRTIETCRSEGIEISHCFCPSYPLTLKKMEDCPPIIYIKGKLRADSMYVACVGTREPTDFGKTVSRRITKALVNADWGIVSGLAIGVDTECHKAALDSGGHTVAILANGLDTIYPKKNELLAKEILSSGGAIISEQPIGVRATAHNLVKRDRIQSGISVATFVMQTDIVGGTMHTVRYTLQQKRLLFAPVPTEKFMDEDKSRGIRALIEKNGPDLAALLNAEKTYKELLVKKFEGSPPAIPIRSASDYLSVAEKLKNQYAEIVNASNEENLMLF